MAPNDAPNSADAMLDAIETQLRWTIPGALGGSAGAPTWSAAAATCPTAPTACDQATSAGPNGAHRPLKASLGPDNPNL